MVPPRTAKRTSGPRVSKTSSKNIHRLRILVGPKWIACWTQLLLALSIGSRVVGRLDDPPILAKVETLRLPLRTFSLSLPQTCPFLLTCLQLKKQECYRCPWHFSLSSDLEL